MPKDDKNLNIPFQNVPIANDSNNESDWNGVDEESTKDFFFTEDEEESEE